MNKTTSILRKQQAEFCKCLFKLEITLAEHSISESWWELLLVVHQLEKKRLAHLQLLIEYERHLPERHWIVVTVVNTVLNRLRRLQTLLANIRVDLNRKICADNAVCADALQQQLNQFQREAQLTISIEETLMKMFEMMTDTPAVASRQRTKLAALVVPDTCGYTSQHTLIHGTSQELFDL